MMKVKVSKSHFEKYKELRKRFPVHLGERVLGLSKEQMLKALSEDEHLNNVGPLSDWDRIGWHVNARNTLSLSEVVCLLKHEVIYNWLGCEPEFK
jgi:hypothetical protein